MLCSRVTKASSIFLLFVESSLYLCLVPGFRRVHPEETKRESGERPEQFPLL